MGESKNKNHPTSFYRYCFRKNKEKMKTTWSEKITYWCAYGPTSSISSSDESDIRKRRAKAPKKRGCRCHFIITKHANNNSACISFLHGFHTNEDNEVCHGENMKKEQPQLSISPWISSTKKESILTMLYKGFTPRQVFHYHIKQVHDRFRTNPNIIPSRDDYLSLKDIYNISQKVAEEKYQLHGNDAESTRRWVNENSTWIFIYQEQGVTEGKPFILGLQSPWQREMCFAFGDNNVLAMDGTFGTNQYKMTLYTIMVFDSHRNGIPVAWIIVSSNKRLDITGWLKAFRDKMLDEHKSWSPNAFLIDDADAEKEAIR